MSLHNYETNIVTYINPPLPLPTGGTFRAPPLESPRKHLLSTIIGITFTLIALTTLIVAMHVKNFNIAGLVIAITVGIGGFLNCTCRRGNAYSPKNRMFQISTGVISCGIAVFSIVGLIFFLTNSSKS